MKWFSYHLLTFNHHHNHFLTELLTKDIQNTWEGENHPSIQYPCSFCSTLPNQTNTSGFLFYLNKQVKYFWCHDIINGGAGFERPNVQVACSQLLIVGG